MGKKIVANVNFVKIKSVIRNSQTEKKHLNISNCSRQMTQSGIVNHETDAEMEVAH